LPTTLIFSRSSLYKDGAMLACLRLLERTDIVNNLHLPYATAYINHVMLWADNLPIKLIVIGQNPFDLDIYPYMGAALSYNSEVCLGPPKSVRSLAEDLYDNNSVPMDQTVRCIRDSWYLLSHGTLMINETIFSLIYPELKSNYRPIMEMVSGSWPTQTHIGAR
jgi:uracil DNA glycosylase